MQLALTEEEAAFRDELRTFYRTEIPAEIRERSRRGGEVSKDDIVTTHKILNDHGLAVPNWPVEWGGKDWTPVQHQIWLDEMQLACVPEPLTFNSKMIGPVIAEFGSQEMKERFLPPTAALDIWWCQGFGTGGRFGPGLAAHHRGPRRRHLHRQRSEDVDHARPARRLDLQPRPHRPAGAQASGRDLDAAHGHEHPGITLRPIKLIDGSFEVNEVFFEDVRVPADQLVGEENKGWSYAKFLLGNERTGITQVGRTR